MAHYRVHLVYDVEADDELDAAFQADRARLLTNNVMYDVYLYGKQEEGVQPVLVTQDETTAPVAGDGQAEIPEGNVKSPSIDLLYPPKFDEPQKSREELLALAEAEAQAAEAASAEELPVDGNG
jgi:hypothetical protein